MHQLSRGVAAAAAGSWARARSPSFPPRTSFQRSRAFVVALIVAAVSFRLFASPRTLILLLARHRRARSSSSSSSSTSPLHIFQLPSMLLLLLIVLSSLPASHSANQPSPTRQRDQGKAFVYPSVFALWLLRQVFIKVWPACKESSSEE